MSLPALYSYPNNKDAWQAWAFNHAAIHYTAVNAANLQKNQDLPTFCLNPIDPDDLGMWLYNHQIMHNQMNYILNVPGYNLLELDWQDQDQFMLWMQLNGDEHIRWNAILGVD